MKRKSKLHEKKTVPGWYGESERPDNGRDPSFLFPFHFHFPSTSFLTSSLFPFKRLVFFVIINQALLSFVSLLSGFTSRYWFDWQTINLIGPIKWCNIGLLFFFFRNVQRRSRSWRERSGRQKQADCHFTEFSGTTLRSFQGRRCTATSWPWTRRYVTSARHRTIPFSCCVFFFWLNNFRLDKRKYFTRLLLRFRRVFFSAFVTVPDPITRTSSGFFDSNKFPYLALYPWGRGFIEFPSKTIRFCKIFLRNQSQLAGMIHRAWFLYYWPYWQGLTGLIR